jgi:hypothetical protein
MRRLCFVLQNRDHLTLAVSWVAELDVMAINREASVLQVIEPGSNRHFFFYFFNIFCQAEAQNHPIVIFFGEIVASYFFKNSFNVHFIPIYAKLPVILVPHVLPEWKISDFKSI